MRASPGIGPAIEQRDGPLHQMKWLTCSSADTRSVDVSH